jgi:hypothetical protein
MVPDHYCKRRLSEFNEPGFTPAIGGTQIVVCDPRRIVVVEE